MPFRVVEVDGQLVEKPSRVLASGQNAATTKLVETTIVTIAAGVEKNITRIICKADVNANWRIYLNSVFQFESGPKNGGFTFDFNAFNILSTEVLDIKVIFNANRTTGICKAAILGYSV